MQILTNIAAPVLVAACFVAAAYLLGKVIGKYQQQDLWRDHMEKCDRYARAVDDLDVWCGHQSPHARLISRHLKAMGEGLAHNAGTPTGDEACTIPGLRVQLNRLDETLRSKNNGD